MGSTVSLPQATANSVSLGTPTMVETRVSSSFIESSIIIRCPFTGREWLASMPGGYSGPLIIYDGPSNQYAPMVVVNHMDHYRSQFSIELPPSPAEYRNASTEVFNWYDKFFKNDIYWFDFPTQYRGMPERFEWRRSSGQEVVESGRLDWLSKGWKLVRAPPEQPNVKLHRDSRKSGISSDGGEIVGVWISRHSLSKSGHFELIGSGLQMGQSFRLMAMASALTIEANVMRIERQRRNNRSASMNFR